MACTSVTTCGTGDRFDLTCRGTIAVPRYVVPKPRTVVLGTQEPGTVVLGT